MGSSPKRPSLYRAELLMGGLAATPLLLLGIFVGVITFRDLDPNLPNRAFHEDIVRATASWWAVAVAVTASFASALCVALSRVSRTEPPFKRTIVFFLGLLMPSAAGAAVALLCSLMSVRQPSEPMSIVGVHPPPLLVVVPVIMVVIAGGIHLIRLRAGEPNNALQRTRFARR